MNEVRGFCESAGFKEDEELIDLARCAVRKLDEALDLPPLKLGKEVDIAENGVCQLRDQLIERLRKEQPAEKEADLRRLLGKVNPIISLLTGAEYPAAGIHREVIEEASKALKDLLSSSPGPQGG